MRFNILAFPLLYALLVLLLSREDISWHTDATFGQTSFLEFIQIGNNTNLELFKYIDETKNTHNLTHSTFENGFSLMHIEGYQSFRSEVRIIISQGVSSDNLQAPGVRYLALKLFTSQVQMCVFNTFKSSENLSASIRSDVLHSRIKFNINGDSGILLDCIVKTIKSKDKFRDLELSSPHLLELTREFERQVRDPNYSSLDLLIINEFIRKKLDFESQLLQMCNAFSVSNYNKSSSTRELLVKEVGDILSTFYVPSLLTLIYMGDLSYNDLKKKLSFFVNAKKSESKLPSPKLESFVPLREKLHSGRNIVSVRSAEREDIVRVFVPFNTDSLDLIASNSFLFLVNLLDSRHRKGIVNFLLANAFVKQSEVGYSFTSGSMVLFVTVKLTRKGLENIPVVVDSIFSYFNLIKKSPLPEKLFSENQHVLDEKIRKDPFYVASLGELYFGVRKAFGLPVKNALNSNLNTQFCEDNVKEFISRMDLSSSIVSFSLKSEFVMENLFFNEKMNNTKPFARGMAERHSNVVFTPIYIDEFYSGSYSDFNPNHGRESYKIELPYSEMASSTVQHSSIRDSMSARLYLLHRAVSEAYLNLKSDTIVSKTMSFKSKLTGRVWYSNTREYGKNVDMLLRFSSWYWAPGFEGEFSDIEQKQSFLNQDSSVKLVAAIHVLSTYLTLETRQILAKVLRFDGSVGFIAAQLFLVKFSTPFEIYLSVRAPANYLTFVLGHIANILNKDISISAERLKNLHSLSRENLLKHYQSVDSSELTSKFVSQMMVPSQHSFDQIDKALEEGVGIKYIRLVSKTLFKYSRLRGRISGVITPFQANHVINFFLKSINHAYFEDVNPSDIPHSNLPFQLTFPSLDVSSIPENMKKTFYRRMDYVSRYSTATIVLFIGSVTLVNSYIKALLLRELYDELLHKELNKKNMYLFSSKVLFSASEFISVELSLRSNTRDTEELSKTLFLGFESANQKIPKVMKNKKSAKNILLRAVNNIRIQDDSFVFATFYHEDLYKVTAELAKGLYHADIRLLVDNVSQIPNLFVAHHKVDNINAAIASSDYIPEGYTTITNPRAIIDTGAVRLVGEYFPLDSSTSESEGK